jgi:hypothetical protein
VPAVWVIASGTVLLTEGTIWVFRSHLLPGSLHLLTVLYGTAVLVVLTLWLLPVWQVSRSERVTADNRFDRENEARKTLAQIIGGVFLLAGLYSSVKTFDLQRQTENLQEQGQITDRFTKAIDQLGAVAGGGTLGVDGKSKPNIEVRLGGIYALERIARDSPRDHWTIMEVLTAYVRENAVLEKKGAGPQAMFEPVTTRVRADVQAAITVIGRRSVGQDPPRSVLDLSETFLKGADLNGAHLEKAIFYKSVLDGADLTNAFLNDADLNGARLIGTYLNGADLRGADVRGANLLFAQGLDSEMLAETRGDKATTVLLGLDRPASWNH